MMDAGLFGKRSRLPAFHSCRGHGDPVYASAANGDIAANILEALSPEQLAGSRHMFDIGVAIVVHLRRSLDKGGACNPQIRELTEPGQEEIEVVGGETDVRIEISDDVEGKLRDVLVTGVEGLYFCGEVAIPSFRHPEQFHPRILR